MGSQPSPDAFAFDGFRWLRNGLVLGGHHSPQFTPSRHDAGARLACVQTVTYPPPLGVTVAAASAPRRVPGAAGPAAARRPRGVPGSGLRLTA
jgi:hypothetical protein